jgi:hypothetical protein
MPRTTDRSTVSGMTNPSNAFGVSVGDRIELLAMPDDPHPVPTGTTGVVTHLRNTPGFEQIGVAWENGRTLALIPGTDSWRRV